MTKKVDRFIDLRDVGACGCFKMFHKMKKEFCKAIKQMFAFVLGIKEVLIGLYVKTFKKGVVKLSSFVLDILISIKQGLIGIYGKITTFAIDVRVKMKEVLIGIYGEITTFAIDVRVKMKEALIGLYVKITTFVIDIKIKPVFFLDEQDD